MHGMDDKGKKEQLIDRILIFMEHKNSIWLIEHILINKYRIKGIIHKDCDAISTVASLSKEN